MDNLLSGMLDEDLQDDENLLASGMVDSLGMYQLITHMEQQYKVKIPVEDVTIENFGTLLDIEGYLTQLIKA
jgi:acyl carrier protein